MRLIDADKLTAELFDADWMLDNDEHMAEEIVERQPTVEAEPVRHGMWDFSGRYRFKDESIAIRCTACGCSLHMAEFLKYTWAYCPTCGAKMSEEEE